jgi:hypothetical protein
LGLSKYRVHRKDAKNAKRRSIESQVEVDLLRVQWDQFQFGFQAVFFFAFFAVNSVWG